MPARLAIICDFAEENWPSMDLCGSMLGDTLRSSKACPIQPYLIRPPMKPRLASWLSGSNSKNADRLINRFWDYPRYIAGYRRQFDYFHIVDHSYSQLVHSLPADRTGVFCHDLEAFRCLLEPTCERRPRWFKAFARRTLRGLQKAAVVFHGSQEVRRQIEHYGLVDPGRLVHAPYGVGGAMPTCSWACLPPHAHEDVGMAPNLCSRLPVLDFPFVLHVGSCAPRKRIDVLLDVFFAVHRRQPDLRLVQLGGAWTLEQRAQIDRLGIDGAAYQWSGLSSAAMANFYRQAHLVLVTSNREGFGLPIIEALANGCIVAASDIAVFREVGGPAVVYCPPGDVPAWVATVEQLLHNPASAPPIDVRLRQAARYTWSAHAQTIAEAYQRLTA